MTIARAATGRPNILVQPRGYHGAGPVWSPGRPGVLSSDTASQLEYQYNSLSSLQDAFRRGEERGGVAAVIVSAFDYRYYPVTY